MQLYYQPEEKIEPITINELDRLGKNLERFIIEYESRILMTEEDKKTMAKLKLIYTNIKYRQYHLLMSDTSLISLNDILENDTPPFDGPYTKINQ